MFTAALLVVSLAAPVPKVKVQNYYPLVVGHKWVYDRDGREVSEEVTEVAEEGGQTRATIAYESGPNSRQEAEYVVKDGVVFKVKAGAHTFDPPVRTVDLVLKPGAKWESKVADTMEILGTGGEMVAGEAEEVTVPAGTFSAIPVTYTVIEMGGKPLAQPRVYTHWYADGVGLVKERYSDQKERVLKSFTPDKERK